MGNTDRSIYSVTQTDTKNDDDDVISDELRQTFEVVLLVFITFFIGLAGVFTNVINIIIFVKHGVNSAVNIGFIGLAVADLFSSLTAQLFCVSFNPWLVNSDIGLFLPEVQHLFAGTPHSAIACVTNWITAFIAFERCLCITTPLNIKRILTPTRTVVIICLIYVLVIIPILPEYTTTYLGPKFFPELNKTLIGLKFTDYRYKVEGVSFLITAILTFMSFVAVLIFTGILVLKMKQKTKWRRMSTFDYGQSEAISRRDRSTVKMVIVVATIFIANFTPTVAHFCGVFIVPGFNIAGSYRNLFLILADFTFVTDALNSSINIVTYYTMSSKYRQTLRQLLCCCIQREKKIYK